MNSSVNSLCINSSRKIVSRVTFKSFNLKSLQESSAGRRLLEESLSDHLKLPILFYITLLFDNYIIIYYNRFKFEKAIYYASGRF